MDALTYSLVIATLDDDGDLALCLESLANLPKEPRFEVIIVDQNSDLHVAGVVLQYSNRLNIVHEHVAFRGASRARNHGARLARGPWLGFPDDDCRLLPDTLLEVDRVRSDPRVGVITGQTIDDDGHPNVLRWKDTSTEFDRWSMFGCMTEATLFVEREIYLNAGGFDQRFGPGAAYPAAEGIDLMNRLFKTMTGRKAVYSPAIKMKHPTKIPPWSRWAVGRFYSYAQGDGALIAKNPELHILYWGLRTLGSASLQALMLRGWRSLAFSARVVGLFKGFLAYQLARWRE